MLVILVGLTSAGMNGETCIVVGKKPNAKGRWLVSVHASGKQVTVKPENTREYHPPPAKPGILEVPVEMYRHVRAGNHQRAIVAKQMVADRLGPNAAASAIKERTFYAHEDTPLLLAKPTLVASASFNPVHNGEVSGSNIGARLEECGSPALATLREAAALVKLACDLADTADDTLNTNPAPITDDMGLAILQTFVDAYLSDEKCVTGFELRVTSIARLAENLRAWARQSQILTSRPFFSKWRKIWI